MGLDVDLHKADAEHHDQVDLLLSSELEIQKLRDWQCQDPDISGDVDGLGQEVSVTPLFANEMFGVPYRMSPPEGVVVKAHPLPTSSPGSPGGFDRDAGEDCRNRRRHHEHGAVDDGAPAHELESSCGKDLHEEAQDGYLGQDDGRDVGDLGDPCVLEKSQYQRLPHQLGHGLELTMTTFVIASGVSVQMSFPMPWAIMKNSPTSMGMEET